MPRAIDGAFGNVGQKEVAAATRHAYEAYEKWIEECEQLALDSESLMSLIDYKMTQGL